MDRLNATSAFSSLHGDLGYAEFTNSGLKLSELTGQGLVRLQGSGTDKAFTAALEKVLGVPLPLVPCTSTQGDGVQCLWLNPSEWLLITSAQRENRLLEELEACTSGYTALVTLNTDSRCGIRIEGEAVEDLLSKGSTLDFHLSGFPVGMCTVARFNSLPVILLRVSESEFDFYIDWTLVMHAWNWLVDAAEEFGRS